MLGIVCFNIIQRFETNEQFSETNEHLQTQTFLWFPLNLFSLPCASVLLSFWKFSESRNNPLLTFPANTAKTGNIPQFWHAFFSLKINCYLITVNWLTQRQKCLIFLESISTSPILPMNCLSCVAFMFFCFLSKDG